jgi:hypothetical protein
MMYTGCRIGGERRRALPEQPSMMRPVSSLCRGIVTASTAGSERSPAVMRWPEDSSMTHVPSGVLIVTVGAASPVSKHRRWQ